MEKCIKCKCVYFSLSVLFETFFCSHKYEESFLEVYTGTCRSSYKVCKHMKAHLAWIHLTADCIDHSEHRNTS